MGLLLIVTGMVKISLTHPLLETVLKVTDFIPAVGYVTVKGFPLVKVCGPAPSPRSQIQETTLPVGVIPNIGVNVAAS